MVANMVYNILSGAQWMEFPLKSLSIWVPLLRMTNSAGSVLCFKESVIFQNFSKDIHSICEQMTLLKQYRGTQVVPIVHYLLGC